MRLLERYVARLMAGLFVILALSVVTLFLVIDLGDWLRLYLGKPVFDVAALYWYRSHVVLVQLAPAALVLSAGLTVTVIRRRGEWTALRALGARPSTVLRPVALVGGLVAVVLVLFQEYVVSDSGPMIDRILLERFGRWGDFSVYLPSRWFRAGDALVNVRGESRPGTLDDVRVLQQASGGQLAGWLEGRRLTHVRDGRWRIEGASELRFEGPVARQGRAGDFDLALPLRPEVTRLSAGKPEWQSLEVLYRQVPLMEALKLPTESTRFAIHQRWALPVAAVLAALIACLLGLRGQAQASVARTLVEGAALYGALFLVGMISRSLALNGRLPVSLAAWLTPLVLVPLLLLAARQSLKR